MEACEVQNSQFYIKAKDNFKLDCCRLMLGAWSCPTLIRLHGLYPARLLCPWNYPGKNTGVVCCSLLQGIFLTQGWNLHLPCCRQILYRLSHLGNPVCPLGSAVLHLALMFSSFFHVVECLKISFSVSNSLVCVLHSFHPFLLQ